MAQKRRHSSADSSDRPSALKKTRVSDIQDHDRITALSDEIVIRILHHLPIRTLISCHLISHRFYLLAGDSQIWKNLYYNRFVLPRALRIPGLKTASLVKQDEALHFASRRSKWLDENTLVNRVDGKTTNWKKQYKLRHNWSIGACEVQEIHVADRPSVPEMLVRLAEGVVITADKEEGLRAWDLKGKAIIATCELEGETVPTCLAVDEQDSRTGKLGIAVGFLDGGWGIWRLDVKGSMFEKEYRHPRSSNGALSAVAFAKPYVLTITEGQLLSLYSFTPASVLEDDFLPPDEAGNQDAEVSSILPNSKVPEAEAEAEAEAESTTSPALTPRLLASLKSHTSWPPLSLSIRKNPTNITASIAYSLPTYFSGYTIGLQELHLSSTTGLITSSRLASALPQGFFSISSSLPSSPSSGTSSPIPGHSSSSAGNASSRPTTLSYSHPYILATHPDNTLTLYLCTSTSSTLSITPGTKLWGHTSSVSSAEITPRGKAVSVSTRGNELRVWELEGGASFASSSASTSSSTPPLGAGVSMTAGSVASNMNELSRARKRSSRLAERSVQILASPSSNLSSPPTPTPKESPSPSSSPSSRNKTTTLRSTTTAVDNKNDKKEADAEPLENKYTHGTQTHKRWVGFDDEMVIVLKESEAGTQALMVYDFT